MAPQEKEAKTARTARAMKAAKAAKATVGDPLKVALVLGSQSVPLTGD